MRRTRTLGPSLLPRLSPIMRADPTGRGMAAWWPLHDSGQIAGDISGGLLNGAAVASPTHAPSIAPAPPGMAFVFNGSTQYVNCGSSQTLNPIEQSVTAWINPSSFPSSYNAIVSRVAAGATSYQQLLITSSGKLAIYTLGGGFYDGSGSHTISAGTTYFVAWTYSIAKGLVGYVNGEVDAAVSPTGSGLTQTSANLLIGSDEGARRWSGQISDVRVFNRALGAEEVQQIYRQWWRPASRPARRQISAPAPPAFTWSPMMPGQHQPLITRPEMIPYG